MVNSFPHVHSFRLSDVEETYYKALLRRFNIPSSNQSVAFRRLLRELIEFLRDLDADSIVSDEPIDEADELSLYEMEPGEDQGDEPDYAKYRREAVQRLVRRGQMVVYRNILAEVRALKKEISS